jgi:hemerythrin-like domain-containing protein
MQPENDILNVLHQDHQNISSLLDLFEKQITILQAGDAPDYNLMEDIMHYMGHYPDAFHHPREEEIFNKVKNNRADIDNIIGRLSVEHIKMAELGEAIANVLSEITSGSIVPIAAISELSREYLDLMRNHINCEEGELFPLVSEVLSQQDWVEINESVSYIDDPLFGKTVEDFYQYLYSCIQQETSHD